MKSGLGLIVAERLGGHGLLRLRPMAPHADVVLVFAGTGWAVAHGLPVAVLVESPLVLDGVDDAGVAVVTEMDAVDVSPVDGSSRKASQVEKLLRDDERFGGA